MTSRRSDSLSFSASVAMVASSAACCAMRRWARVWISSTSVRMMSSEKQMVNSSSSRMKPIVSWPRIVRYRNQGIPLAFLRGVALAPSNVPETGYL
jgi:hypothetical protein